MKWNMWPTWLHGLYVHCMKRKRNQTPGNKMNNNNNNWIISREMKRTSPNNSYALWSFPMLYGVFLCFMEFSLCFMELSLHFMEFFTYTLWSVILYLYRVYDVLIEISEYGMTRMIDYFYKEQYHCWLNRDSWNDLYDRS